MIDERLPAYPPDILTDKDKYGQPYKRDSLHLLRRQPAMVKNGKWIAVKKKNPICDTNKPFPRSADSVCTQPRTACVPVFRIPSEHYGRRIGDDHPLGLAKRTEKCPHFHSEDFGIPGFCAVGFGLWGCRKATLSWSWTPRMYSFPTPGSGCGDLMFDCRHSVCVSG